MASSHDRTCPRDLLQGLVAGTSPLVCGDLNAVRRDIEIRGICKCIRFESKL